MKKYKSKLNIKFGDHAGAIALWCVAIVCTLGFAAIPFQIWFAKLILDNWEIEEIDNLKERDNDLRSSSRRVRQPQPRSQWD